MPECDTLAQIGIIVIAISNLVTAIITKKTQTTVKETSRKVDTNTEITLSTKAAVSRAPDARTRASDKVR